MLWPRRESDPCEQSQCSSRRMSLRRLDSANRRTTQSRNQSARLPTAAIATFARFISRNAIISTISCVRTVPNSISPSEPNRPTFAAEWRYSPEVASRLATRRASSSFAAEHTCSSRHDFLAMLQSAIRMNQISKIGQTGSRCLGWTFGTPQVSRHCVRTSPAPMVGSTSL